MINTNNLKKGIVLKLDNVLYEVIDHYHYKPGKGQAFVKAKLKNLNTNTITEKKLRSNDKVEDVYINKKGMQYLYDEGDALVFMDTETYEQMSISIDTLGNDKLYLKEGEEISVKFYNDEIIGIDLPPHVVLEVTYTEKGVRGDTATSATKPIQLETGLEIQAPLFINTGDKVKIDTRNGQYVERA